MARRQRPASTLIGIERALGACAGPGGRPRGTPRRARGRSLTRTRRPSLRLLADPPRAAARGTTRTWPPVPGASSAGVVGRNSLAACRSCQLSVHLWASEIHRTPGPDTPAPGEPRPPNNSSRVHMGRRPISVPTAAPCFSPRSCCGSTAKAPTACQAPLHCPSIAWPLP